MITIQFTNEELPDLRRLLDRAMGTWEPKDQPPWLRPLSDYIDHKMGRAIPISQGMRPINETPDPRSESPQAESAPQDG